MVSLAAVPALGGYGVSKAAASSMTQALRAELAARNIEVYGQLDIFPDPMAQTVQGIWSKDPAELVRQFASMQITRGQSRRCTLQTMSDLQCPANFVLLTRETAEACDLAELRLSLVVCERATHAIVQRLAAKDRCTIEPSALASAAELRAKIEQLADQYRGEQVAVIADGEVLRAALEQHAAPTAPIHIAVDSDGWKIRLK